jgi:hypothetical protein
MRVLEYRSAIETACIYSPALRQPSDQLRSHAPAAGAVRSCILTWPRWWINKSVSRVTIEQTAELLIVFWSHRSARVCMISTLVGTDDLRQRGCCL